MTNTEARPHLIKAYKDMRSPAFDQHVYTDKEDYRALRWVIKKGINLQGFRLERAGEKRSGVILARLMGWDADQQEQERKLDIAKYYATRGKMQDLDEAVDGNGRTALYVASRRGYVDIVKGMLAAGANKDKADDHGSTPLFIAARKGHIEVVNALIVARADLNKAMNNGATPLFIAARKGHIEVVNALIAARADLNKARDNGATPLIIAAWKGHIQAVNALLRAGANQNLADDDGDTPLSLPSSMVIPR